MITDSRIDSGKAFDWGKTSEDYAKFRDIYPEEFYSRILECGLCTEGQHVLDVGTGTGVLPRNMYRFGADFTASDISENQIEQARILSRDMNIKYITAPAEEAVMPENSLDAITACQCYFYFKHDIFAAQAHKMLKQGGKLAFLYMAWLPFEDEIAGKSEKLVLKYNPDWSGCNETRHEIYIPDEYKKHFTIEESITFDADIPFTRESWNGRILACRGIGASLSDDIKSKFDAEHRLMLEQYPEKFTVKHYCAIAVLKAK